MKLIKIDIYDLVSLLSNKMFIYFNKKIEREVKETQKESTFFSNLYNKSKIYGITNVTDFLFLFGIIFLLVFFIASSAFSLHKFPILLFYNIKKIITN
jgi:hypothetical protein